MAGESFSDLTNLGTEPPPTLKQTSLLWGGRTIGHAEISPYGVAWMIYLSTLAGMSHVDRYGILDTTHSSYSGHLAPTNPAGTTLRIASGAAFVRHWLYTNDANIDNNLSVMGYYRIVLRANEVAQTVTILVLGPETRGYPSYKQISPYWDLPIARAYSTGAGITTLLDDRVFFRNLSLVRRQGGNPSSWDTSGTTGYVTNAVQINAGATPPSMLSTTFPREFSSPPVVFYQVKSTSQPTATKLIANPPANDIESHYIDVTTYMDAIMWLAIGQRRTMTT